MRYQNNSRGDSNIINRVVCALVFLLFSFFWLYHFQADMLAVAQHGLSGGKTHYDRTVGAVIICAVLMGVQLLVYSIVRLSRSTHALTYVPSFLLLSFVSSVEYPFSWGVWLLVAPLVLAVWGLVVWLLKKNETVSWEYRRSSGLLSRTVWVNQLQLAVMMLVVAAVSNTNAVAHFKAHAEVALMEDDVDEALRVGKRSLETDESLTMLRAFALSKKGELADRLFEYAISGTGADLLPLSGSNSRLMLMSDTLLWHHFGVYPDSIAARMDSASRSHQMTMSQYFDSLACDTMATTAWRDYALMARLIDRDVEGFAKLLPRHYVAQADSLPRHYREALVLYQQTRDSVFAYSDSLMLLLWNDFCSYDSLYPKPSERMIRLEERYRGNYWYYYYQ